MNILLLIDVLPPKYSGMTLRLINIFKELGKNHCIHFIYIDNKEIEPIHRDFLKGFCKSIQRIALNNKQFFWGRVLNILTLKHGYYAKYRFKEDYENVREKLNEYIIKNDIKIVHVFGCFTAQYIENINTVYKIWDIADSYSLEIKRKIKQVNLFSRINLYLSSIRLINYEKEIIKNFSTTIFVSNIDANVYRNLGIYNKIFVIPNGVDFEYFRPQENYEESNNMLIFSGHMSFPPNIDAVNYFINRIYPLIKREVHDIQFYIVGADASKDLMSLNNEDGIVVTNSVNDIRPFLSKATIFVNPMINGVGIKNKVLQAMAMRKAIVSTRIGVGDISVTENKDIFLADKPEEFAHKVIMLIKDKNLRTTLGANARKIIEEKYNWNRVVSVYKNIYENIAPKELKVNRG